MGRRCFSVAALLAAFLASSRALALDWYVDGAAAAGGDGSQARPFATISGVLPGLSRGDTVWIAGGTYDEIVNVVTLPGTTGTTTFRAMAGATPVIDGTSGSSSAGYVVQTAVPNTMFQGLTIQNAVGGALGIQFYYADGGQVIDCVTKNMSANAITFYYSSQGTVTGCTCQGNISGRKTTGTVVENNEVYGASAEGIGLYDGSTGCTVSHNVIHDNYSVNLYLDSISHSTFDGNLIYETSSNDLEGIEISDEYYSDLAAPVNSYNTIVNNVIVGNNLGIVFWYSGEWPTQALNDQSGLRYDVISNNTVVNSSGSLKWDSSPAHVGTTIQNNVFAAAAGTSPINLLQANDSGNITLDHNLWFAPDLPQPFLWLSDEMGHAGFVTASGQGGGDVLSNPLFTGAWTVPPATNLELTMTSPAVGAGVSLSAVTQDFLGAPRPTTGVDIGAFQYGAVAPADGGVGPAGDASAAAGEDGAVASSAGDGSTVSTVGLDASDDSGGEPGSGSTTSADGGPVKGGGSSSGCSCSHAGSGGPTDGRWLVLAFAVASLRRRRRVS